jgi:hypothetical protein
MKAQTSIEEEKFDIVRIYRFCHLLLLIFVHAEVSIALPRSKVDREK